MFTVGAGPAPLFRQPEVNELSPVPRKLFVFFPATFFPQFPSRHFFRQNLSSRHKKYGLFSLSSTGTITTNPSSSWPPISNDMPHQPTTTIVDSIK
jgi:hypothetical protein